MNPTPAERASKPLSKLPHVRPQSLSGRGRGCQPHVEQNDKNARRRQGGGLAYEEQPAEALIEKRINEHAH